MQHVPAIVLNVIFSPKKIALNIKALDGTRNIKELTSLVPNLFIPIKYIDVAKVVDNMDIMNMFNQNKKSKSFKLSKSFISIKKL